MEPTWKDNVPWCSEECRYHSTQWCELLQAAPLSMCEPMVRGMTNIIIDLRRCVRTLRDAWDEHETTANTFAREVASAGVFVRDMAKARLASVEGMPLPEDA